MKKTIAVLLSLLLAFSLAIPVFAAQSAAETREAAAILTGVKDGMNAVTRLSKSFIRSLVSMIAARSSVSGKDLPNAEDVVSSLLSKAFAEVGQGITYADLASVLEKKEIRPAAKRVGADDTFEGDLSVADLGDLLKNYIFVRIDDPEEAAKAIADASVYEYTVIEGEHGTVYIRVNLAEHPELFNAAVFRALVEKLYEGQKEEMLRHDDGSVDYLMSYEHIAGELALHAIVYAAASGLIGLVGEDNETLYDLYRSAVVADLNVDEKRLSPQMIELFGKVLLGILRLNVFRLTEMFG